MSVDLGTVVQDWCLGHLRPSRVCVLILQCIAHHAAKASWAMPSGEHGPSWYRRMFIYEPRLQKNKDAKNDMPYILTVDT